MNDIEFRHILNLLAYANKLADDTYKKAEALAEKHDAELAKSRLNDGKELIEIDIDQL